MHYSYWTTDRKENNSSFMVYVVNLENGNTSKISVSSFLRGGSKENKDYKEEILKIDNNGGDTGNGGIRRRESPKEESLGIFSFAPGNPFDKEGSDKEEDVEGANNNNNNRGAERGGEGGEGRGEDEKEDGLMNDLDGCFNLSYKQRFIGFICCMLGGIILVIVGLLFLLSGDIGLFISCFSLGNILSLLSTMFLMGIIQQFKRMFKPIRMIATSVFLVCILLAIYFGMIEKDDTLALLFGILEIIALLWYSLTYVPIINRMISCGF